jgi:coproporphyrinogen III oxidase-like Fe-S oxidoreductase
MLIMGLRLREGLDLGRLRVMTGFSPNAGTIADLRSSGLLAPYEERHPERLAATRDGRFVLNTLVLEISRSLEP